MTRRWHVIDAEGKALGRVATAAARMLQGKHKATYTPFIDTGDHVVIVNAAKVKLTGRKEDQKLYRRHSGYAGGLREERAKVVRSASRPRLVEEAVRGMLPKSDAGRRDVPQTEGLCRATRIRTPRSNPLRSRSHNLAATAVSTLPGAARTSTARVFLRPGHGRHHRQPPRVRRLLPHRVPARRR